MAPKSPELTLEEIPGTRYQDLTAAQRQSLAETASDLTAALRALLAAGALVIQNGRIIPKPQG